jgi:glycosyltransferase involved in cell wall biosynthesis
VSARLPGAGPRISVVIPALDEEASIGQVLAELPWPLLQQVVVADNGSRDATAAVARRGGADVVPAPRPGYGSACLAGLAALRPTDIVVFLDADRSDYPGQLPEVVAPLLEGRADLVIGSRALGQRGRGSMLPQQRFGNWLATRMIRLLWGHRCTDLGPFRAVTTEALARIGMADPDFGWTVEMQVRALQEGLRVTEVPVDYRRRVGRSKIAGTVRGTVLAGITIISVILRLWWRGRRHQRSLRAQS